MRRTSIAEAVKRQTQPGKFRRGNAGVIHHRRAPQTGDFLRQARASQPGKFRRRLEVDVERIEKKPAVGRIRACPLGLVGKERV